MELLPSHELESQRRDDHTADRSKPGIRARVLGVERLGAKVDRCPHVGHHHEGCLLGLVEGVHLALQVALLEHQRLAVDLCLAVLAIQTGNLQAKRRERREEFLVRLQPLAMHAT